MQAKKRFYKDVTSNVTADGWSIKLDSRALRSPAGTPLLLPTAGLADAVAGEWAAQIETIDPASMPLFSLAVTVVDRVVPQQGAVVAELAGYGGNDLLCYRDDNDDLARRQQQTWQPWLDWAEAHFGARLNVAVGIMPVAQPDAPRFHDHLHGLDAWRLAVLHRAVSLGGSLVLGLGFLMAKLDSEQLFETAFLDELWQNEKWGSDYEAQDRRDYIRAELQDAARFLALLPQPASQPRGHQP
jgi:chaperone required for assembly of F1-ATPase